MRNIYPPKGLKSERAYESIDALEPAFLQFVDRAELAGWTRAEILRAVQTFVSPGYDLNDGECQKRVA
jgi:hypothetical protein